MTADVFISDKGNLVVTIRPTDNSEKVVLALCQYQTPMLDYAKDEPDCLEFSLPIRKQYD